MDGVLVIDKPRGLTSHDVVAAARRALGEPHLGHTGTLDPLATGVLPLVVGRATRLVRFLAASDKDYVADVRFGLTTDSYDITGAAQGGSSGQVPSRAAILEAVQRLTGDYLQVPPAFSAKKVEGRRAYQLARQDQTVALAPVPVSVTRADLLELAGARARIALTCSAGFYVRSFAHSLGELTGTGACLEALQRTRSGEFGVAGALTLDALEDRARVAASLVPLAGTLGRIPAAIVTDRGRTHVSHGRELGPEDLAAPAGQVEWVRLLDGSGALVALATPGKTPGSLHPAVVLI
jgi:tRNA pseudouridine55 synthase